MFQFSKISLAVFFFCFFVFQQAQAQMTPEEACNRAGLIDAKKCLSGLKSNSYYNDYAMEACTKGSSFDIQSCVHSAAGVYFQKAAVLTCRDSASSGNVVSCLVSIANKVFTSEIISECANQFSSEVVSCFTSAQSTPNTLPKTDPIPTGIVQVCSHFPTNQYQDCLNIVSASGGKDFFHPLATGVCNRSKESEFLLECINGIAQLDFSDSDVLTCGRELTHERALTCLKTVGKPMDDDDRRKVCKLGRPELRDVLSRLRTIEQSLRRSDNSNRAERLVQDLRLSLSDCMKGIEYSSIEDRRSGRGDGR